MLFGALFALLLTALFWKTLREQQNRIERFQKELLMLLREQSEILRELQRRGSSERS